MIVAGVLCGTSLDGIDVGIVRIVPRGQTYATELLRFETVAFGEALREAIVDVLPPRRGSTEAVAALHAAVGEAFGDAVARVTVGQPIDVVASHGVTIWHDPARRFTLQLGDPFRIRERCGVTVAYDFRSGDTAAGGEGAPLVPYVDALLLGSPDEDRVALNIGGIANVTILPRAHRAEAIVAFDTGPGNMLLDAFVFERTGGRERFDRDGGHARRGTIDRACLRAMRDDRYFAQPAPKSTGREVFGAAFLARFASRLETRSIDDGCATLAALTATTIADAIREHAREARAIVSGGGSHNSAIMAMLKDALGERVETSDRFGLPVDAKEAIAFAVLGYETLRGRAAGLPSVTGARRSAVLGALAPHGLRELMLRIEEEGRSSVKSAE